MVNFTPVSDPIRCSWPLAAGDCDQTCDQQTCGDTDNTDDTDKAADEADVRDADPTCDTDDADANAGTDTVGRCKLDPSP